MPHRDPLTGLPSRVAYQMEVADRIAGGEEFALLLVDMDRFKVVNGVHSHMRADWLLRQVGQAVAALDPLAPVFRVGGDEFVVLLPIGDIREATLFAQRIRAVVSSIDLLASGEPEERDDPAAWRLDCSIDIARWPEDAGTADGLERAADMAVYLVKRAGGAGVKAATHVAAALDG